MRVAIEVLKCVYLLFVIIRKVITLPPVVVVAIVSGAGVIGLVRYIWLAIRWMHVRWVAYRTGSIIPNEVIVQDTTETDPAGHFGHPVAG